MSKTFNLAPRKPSLSEDAVLKLENAVAAKGEGVAGQAAAVAVPQAHKLTSPSLATPSVPVKVEADVAVEKERDEPSGVVDSAASANTISSRARGAARPRARELPITGVGTLHNPRVRKTDGVKTRSTTVHFPIDLAKKLAVHCAMTGRKQSDLITDAVEALLGG